MVLLDGRTWLEFIPPAECWQLLSGTPVGRIGTLVDSAPEIYPVNFVVDQETIVFRTDSGNKLRALGRSPSICFEADELDLADHTGWSVLVKGQAVELADGEGLRRAALLPLHFWALGEKAHWIRILPVEVTGRRIYRRKTR